MRRLIGTTLLAAVLLGLGAAACGTKAEETPTAATTSSAPAAQDKTAACAAFQTEWEALQMRALEGVGLLQAAFKDSSQSAKAAEHMRKLYADMQTSVDKHVATAADPEFKAALTGFQEQLKAQGKNVEAAGQDVQKISDIVNDDEFQKAVSTLSDLCGW